MCKRRSTILVEIGALIKERKKVRLDACMGKLIQFINTHPNVKTLACCCGHGRYNMTIVVSAKTGMDGNWKWETLDLMSGVKIPRKTRFYFRDKKGYFYIPEVEDYWRQKIGIRLNHSMIFQ